MKYTEANAEAGSQRLSLEHLHRWEALKFGMFIHFGMSTTKSDEMSRHRMASIKPWHITEDLRPAQLTQITCAWKNQMKRLWEEISYGVSLGGIVSDVKFRKATSPAASSVAEHPTYWRQDA